MLHAILGPRGFKSKLLKVIIIDLAFIIIIWIYFFYYFILFSLFTFFYLMSLALDVALFRFQRFNLFQGHIQDEDMSGGGGGEGAGKGMSPFLKLSKNLKEV